MNMIIASTANDSSCKEDLVDVLLKLQKSSDLKFEITTKHIEAATSVCLNLALAILSVFQLLIRFISLKS